MKLPDIVEFVSKQIEVSDLPAEGWMEFTSGGPDEDVWCVSETKAVELFCYEFSKYAKEQSGVLHWGIKPEMTGRKFQSRNQSAYMDNKMMYCVYATFAIKEQSVEAA